MNDGICCFCPTYMDCKAISVTAPLNYKFGLKKIYYVDGPFVGFSKEPKSKDGTIEFVKSLGDRAELIEAGESHEYEKFNLAAHRAMEEGFKYMIILGSDEYLTGDITEVVNIMNKEYTEEAKMYDVHIIEYQPNKKYNRPLTRLSKMFVNPAWCRARDIHWFYFMNGSETPILTSQPLLPMTLHHDDSVRDDSRNNQMEKWQDKHVLLEDKIVKEKWIDKVLAAEYPPVKSRGGWLYWTCSCIMNNNGIFTNKCEGHKIAKPKYTIPN